MKAAYRDLQDAARLWAGFFWKALRGTVGVLRRHLGKELMVAAALFALAFPLKEGSPFVDELRNSLYLLGVVTAIYGSALFVCQLAMAPVRMRRELVEHRLQAVQDAEREREKLLKE